jgi:hypothetical protein
MVGPLSAQERADGNRRLKLGAVLLVGASAGLISLQAEIPLWYRGLFVAGGLLVGAALVWYLSP